MDSDTDSDFDFPLEAHSESDNESVYSEEGNDGDMILLDDWHVASNQFDSFEIRSYTLRSIASQQYENDILFVDSVMMARRLNENATAIRLLADIHDPDDEESTRWSQNIRFELMNFASINDLRSVILDHIQNQTAPIWHRLLSDEASDKGYNKIVVYHKDYFDICVQTPTKTRTQVTTVCGEREIHPGIFTKVITDHNISYRSNDCLIMCLNEVLNERHDPFDIRKQIRTDSSRYHKDIHTPRHIASIARIYNTKIVINDILEQKRHEFNTSCKNTTVKLIKVGKVIGIKDYIDRTVDKRNTTNDTTYFDLETVGPDQRVYAFTWRHKKGDLTVCHNNYDQVEDMLVEHVYDVLSAGATDEKIIAYSWNGSHFDSWIMFKLLKRKYNKKLWIHNIIINSGNELLSFTITLTLNGSKTHMVFKDAKKMFNLPLEEACDTFGIQDGKLKLEHNDIDKAFSDNTFDEYIRLNRSKIIEYVRRDGVVLEQVTKEIAALYTKQNINMYTVLTRSVASSISWRKTIENASILKDVTLSPYEYICGVRYNDIMDHAIGGRSQCVTRGIFNNVCGIDVNSMYPYVASHNLYPCGSITELRHGEHPPKDKLGLYLVKIKRQSYPNVVPHRLNKNKPYNWEYSHEFEKWITNIDMEQLDDYEVIKGFYWNKTTDKFYKAFMIDKYAERSAIPKTDPMNLHIKLEMNGVTGSVFQHSFREMIMIFTKDEFISNVKKYNELVHIIGCESVNEQQYIVTMRPIKLKPGDPRIKAQQEFCKSAITQKPWVLTMFTYSYARRELRNEWIKLEHQGCQVLYCDTDSLFFTNPDNAVSRKSYNNTKELGKWSVECWNDEGAFFTPKVYSVKNIGKLRIKGVRSGSLVVQTHHQSKDLTYEQKQTMYLNACKDPDSKHPSHHNVVSLVRGTPLKTIDFHMERSQTAGILKKYTIKIVK